MPFFEDTDSDERGDTVHRVVHDLTIRAMRQSAAYIDEQLRELQIGQRLCAHNPVTEWENDTFRVVQVAHVLVPDEICTEPWHTEYGPMTVEILEKIKEFDGT